MKRTGIKNRQRVGVRTGVKKKTLGLCCLQVQRSTDGRRVTGPGTRTAVWPPGGNKEQVDAEDDGGWDSGRTRARQDSPQQILHVLPCASQPTRARPPSCPLLRPCGAAGGPGSPSACSGAASRWPETSPLNAQINTHTSDLPRCTMWHSGTNGTKSGAVTQRTLSQCGPGLRSWTLETIRDNCHPSQGRDSSCRLSMNKEQMKRWGQKKWVELKGQVQMRSHSSCCSHSTTTWTRHQQNLWTTEATQTPGSGRVACSNTWTLDPIRSDPREQLIFRKLHAHGWKTKKADGGTEPERHSADLQRHSDCPADWCTPQRHSLSPEEEEPSQSSTGEIKC